jgi:hypothetical protein
MGLRAGDLKHTIYDIFEIDSYASKMGDDKNIVTLSFSLSDQEPAKDLASFLEKGYEFILDADVTSGEQSDGTYKVFVEMERDRNIAERISEILDGVKKLSEKENLKFRYYKDFKSQEATLENIENSVPIDPDNYGIVANESNLRNFKNFFNRSYLDSIDMLESTLHIKKMYADPLAFEVIDIVEKDNLVDVLSESFDVNAYAEILFLTKYIGDYNISKYGDKLVFENENKALIVKRI